MSDVNAPLGNVRLHGANMSPFVAVFYAENEKPRAWMDCVDKP